MLVTKRVKDVFNLYVTGYRGISKQAWLGILVNFIETTLVGIFYFLSYYFVNTLGFSIKTAGIIISCYGLGAMAGGFFGGKLSDQFNPKQLSAFFLLVIALSFFSFVFLKDKLAIGIITTILGIASYGFTTANYTFILSSCGGNEGIKLRAINLLAVISNFALGLSALVIGFFSHYGFSYLFFTNTVLALILALFVFLTGNKRINEPAAAETRHESKPQATTVQVKLLIVLSSVFFIGAIVSQISTTFSIYIQSTFPFHGLNGFSILFTINTIMVVLLQSQVGELIAKFNKLTMVSLGSLLIGLGMLLLAVAPFFALIILAVIIYTFGEMIFFSVAPLVCYDSASANKKGTYLGLFRTIFASSRVIGPLSGGYIYHHISGSAVWYISAIVAIMCSLSCFYYRNLASCHTNK